MINGIDCTDVTRSFTADEWHQAGPTGRAHINTAREHIHNSGRRGGSGGRGGRDGDRGRGRFIQEVNGRGRGHSDVPTEDTNDNHADDAAEGASIVTGSTISTTSGRSGTAGRGFGRGMYGRGRWN